MAMKINFPTINSLTTQSSLYSHKTWGGVWVVIAISSLSFNMANRIGGFGPHKCMWIPSEVLEPVFHRLFIWNQIGDEDSCRGDILGE